MSLQPEYDEISQPLPLDEDQIKEQIDSAIKRLLTKRGPGRFAEFAADGISDRQLVDYLKSEIGRGINSNSENIWAVIKADPFRLWVGSHGTGRPTIQGKELVARIRA